jgi:hypothetical protein
MSQFNAGYKAGWEAGRQSGRADRNMTHTHGSLLSVIDFYGDDITPDQQLYIELEIEAMPADEGYKLRDTLLARAGIEV